jgi:hypothetical protein
VLTNFRDKVGQTLAFEVTGSDQGTVWGTNPYTDDSPLAVAAVHAGVLRVGEKGVVRVTISPGRDSYTGTTHNGITSLPYGAWEGSYQFDLPARRRARIFDSGTGAPAGGGGFTPERNPGGPEIFRFQPSTDDLRSRRGQSFDVLVTGSTEGSVWGSDVYTDDSSLAAAAVHAGLLKNGETGIVRVTPLPGQDSYTPSNRNGVTSEAWQQWDGSFRVEKGEEGGKTDKTEKTEKTEKTDTILRTTGKNDTTEPRK